VVLPATVDLLETNTNSEEATGVEVGEDLLIPDPLVAATDAAVSSISNVAAASKNKSFMPGDSLGSIISRTSFDETSPTSSVTNDKYASTYLVDSAVSDNDASSNTKLNTNDLMIFKQDPSTSGDKNRSPSNMILACTGNNSEENYFERYAILHIKSIFVYTSVF
jgi:hypothetical protein